jgi:hypothetical protein
MLEGSHSAKRGFQKERFILIFFGLLTVDAQLALYVCLDPEVSSPF